MCTVEGKRKCVLNPHVAPENLDAWDLWNRSQSCWVVGFSGIERLDLPAVKTVAEAMGVEWTEDLLARIGVLENHTLTTLSEKKK